MTAEKPPKAGILGWPVEHSLSPPIHRYWLDRYGLDGTYDLLPVAPESFHARVRSLQADGYCGANVTVPHKVAAFEAVDEATDLARRIGAVNTLYYEGSRLVGTNTDASGFLENLRQGARDWSIETGPAVVLGAGGAARAVLVALQDAGCPAVTLLNRTRQKAEALADTLGPGIEVRDWTERAAALEGTNLLVNSTALGMGGQPPLEIDLAALPRAALVNDIVYRPLETPLLATARGRGHPTVDGLGMLLHQARPGFRKWFGPLPDPDEGNPDAPEVTPELHALVLQAAQ